MEQPRLSDLQIKSGHAAQMCNALRPYQAMIVQFSSELELRVNFTAISRQRQMSLSTWSPGLVLDGRLESWAFHSSPGTRPSSETRITLKTTMGSALKKGEGPLRGGQKRPFRSGSPSSHSPVIQRKSMKRRRGDVPATVAERFLSRD